MDFILGALASALRGMSAVLGGWSFARDLAQDIERIRPYLEKANMIIPIDTALTILSIYLALQLVLIAYYWITRAINLLRGAG